MRSPLDNDGARRSPEFRLIWLMTDKTKTDINRVSPAIQSSNIIDFSFAWALLAPLLATVALIPGYTTQTPIQASKLSHSL